MNKDAATPLVFSDLDGSLLDHHTYSFAAALPVINTLEDLGIPLILVSSKTRAEIVELRATLKNSHPFIVENGAAVFLPRDTFPTQPADTTTQGDYWVHEMTPPRSQWLTILKTLKSDFPGEFESFHSAGVAGIMAMTGLSESAALAADDRQYSEPVKWLGTAQRETVFIQRLQAAGATVARGGRFLAVSGGTNKGQALCWLRSHYCQHSASGNALDLAIGDGENDLPMLEAAHTALLIRSPAHDFPVLRKVDSVTRSQKYGPAGWAEGVLQWLQSNGITA